MFEAVLVANRGEIAVRIVRTLRRLGIRSVVVCAIPDRHSLAARSADETVVLDGYTAAETYLDAEAVIAAANARRCQAVHPGYGFLSERPDFAERCASAGLAFVGPPAAVLRAVGDKAAARRLAVANGVPVVPGWDADDDDATLEREGERIGFPLMVKARGGGGGRGMRVVDSAGDLAEALAAARREALAAFGDSGLLLERLVTGAHHVEVQVLCDARGHAVHLGERDCSIQRRRQKLIEETPSPVIDDRLRHELTSAALRMAAAAGYINAGTFEFLVGGDTANGQRPFFFLEVNPRLQVEHPVTEMVTGLDLVELQLRVAAGEPLPVSQDEVRFDGHAIEFRVNAEDPWDAFRPSAGRVAAPGGWSAAGYEARVDPGYVHGDVVPAQFDSLLGKWIMHESSREKALARASEVLNRLCVSGVRTNVRLLEAIAAAEAFRTGDTDIGWLERNLDDILAGLRTPDIVFALAARAIRSGAGQPWRVGGAATFWLTDGVDTRRIDLEMKGPSQTVFVDGRLVLGENRAPEAGYRSVPWPPRTLTAGSPVVAARVSRTADGPGGAEMPPVRELRLTPPPALPRRPHVDHGGGTVVTAPLAGTLVAAAVAVGQTVSTGQLLAVIDAMKMEHRITATAEGTVRSVLASVGGVVREGDVLFEIE